MFVEKKISASDCSYFSSNFSLNVLIKFVLIKKKSSLFIYLFCFSFFKPIIVQLEQVRFTVQVLIFNFKKFLHNLLPTKKNHARPKDEGKISCSRKLPTLPPPPQKRMVHSLSPGLFLLKRKSVRVVTILLWRYKQPLS